MSDLVTSPSTPPSYNARIAAAIAHAGTCVAWFLAPLLVFLLATLGESKQSEETAWVARQALGALLWSGLGTIVSFATCGLAIPLFLAVHLYAAYQAYSGREFEYPLLGSVVRSLQSR